ncbi:MAG: TolC family protein [Parabacteroides sp.]|nr:TolC family protein [Parabacteroides sp.]
MRRFLLMIVCVISVWTVGAQNTLEEVLRNVEVNNKELQANRQFVTAQKLEIKVANNLPDPSVTYSHLYGNKEGMGFTGEFIASQAFDFPTLYVQRNKLSKIKGEAWDRQSDEVRQQILLQAKEICLDLVLLNQQKSLLEIRRQNAEQLSTLYDQRLKNGDANILEVNKINLELLNVRNEVRMNEALRISKLQELAVLNGGVEIQFNDTVYMQLEVPSSFVDLKQEVMSLDRRLLVLQSEKEASQRQIKVNKSKGLPSFNLGYRMNPSSGGNRYNGFLVGVSIPIFSNRNNVRQAKAQSLYADLQLDNAETVVERDLLQLYNQAIALKTSMDEYNQVLKNQNNLVLLNKAIEAGQISMIEYFVDVTTLYDSMQNYMQLQNEYQKIMAQLYKFKL